MEIALGLLIGLVIGGGAVFLYFRSKQTLNPDLEARLQETFTAISNDVLQKSTSHILELAESKLTGKKEIIDTSLQAVKNDLKRVEDLMKNIGEKNVAIDTRLENAANVISKLNTTTDTLRNALSSNSGRGQWGERMAEDVLRLSGMMEGINYIKQKKVDTGSKPDFTFLLPQNLKLNMDVKFPFNNYQSFTEATNDRDRDDSKKKFLKDVRQRVKEVQTRDYINPEDKTVDYVLLFVPNEQIFGFINEIDRELIDEAMRGKTILCSPMSLYAILAVIRQSIDNFRLESKSQEMLSLFGSFKLQWEKFKEQMDTVKDRFDTVHKGYEELTGARERQLDRYLGKIDDVRVERGIEPAEIEATFDKVAKKQMVSSARDVV